MEGRACRGDVAGGPWLRRSSRTWYAISSSRWRYRGSCTLAWAVSTQGPLSVDGERGLLLTKPLSFAALPHQAAALTPLFAPTPMLLGVSHDVPISFVSELITRWEGRSFLHRGQAMDSPADLPVGVRRESDRLVCAVAKRLVPRRAAPADRALGFRDARAILTHDLHGALEQQWAVQRRREHDVAARLVVDHGSRVSDTSRIDELPKVGVVAERLVG